MVPWRFVTLCLIGHLLPGVGAFGQDPVEQIRALRERSNEAIARQDAEAVVSFLDAEYTLIAGNGTFYPGYERQLELRQETFALSDEVSYTRTPDRIELSEEGTRAAELGRREGRSVTDSGPVDYTGHYAAYWRIVDGDWKIHAELFVTMTCDGPGC